MSDWSEGYVNEIGYTYGYYSELNPANIKIPFLMAGIAPPEIVTACELGFGQGFSVNVHAATSNAQWFGTDFNPSHANFAQKLANYSQTNSHLVDQAFSEFCQRDDLPDFDYICLHGIWTWVSDDNRKILVDFFKRKLKIGGVLYISYNTLPGWSIAAPIRHMFNEHAHIMGSRGEGPIERVKKSVEFTKNLLDLCQKFQNEAPTVKSRLEKISEHNPSYLAHEYFNKDWLPMYFSEMNSFLSDAKLDYVCAANFANDFKASNFNQEQLQFLDSIKDTELSETVKDYMKNTQFRKDYWVKGGIKLSKAEIYAQWMDVNFILMKEKDKIDYSLSGVIGKVSLIAKYYEPIVAVLKEEAITSVADIRKAVDEAVLNDAQLFEALAILNTKGVIAIAQETQVIKDSLKSSHLLNTYLLKNSLVSEDIAYLVSPVTGSAIGFNRINKIFLYLITQGEKNPKKWVEKTWGYLSKMGHKLVKDGKQVESEADNLTRISEMTEDFIKTTLPICKKLQLVENKHFKGL